MYRKNKKTVKIIMLLFFVNTLFLYAQKRDTLTQENIVKDTLPFVVIKAEESLKILFDSLYQQGQLHHVNSIAAEISSIFDTLLINKKTFTYPFDSLKIGKIYSPDSLFRLYTWNANIGSGHYRYFGYVQSSLKKDDDCKLFKLKHTPLEINNMEDTIYTAENWYGALYYDIIKTEYEDQTYYTVLGVDLHDLFTRKRIIDVIRFNKNKGIIFGAPIFKTDKSFKKRLVFEYSSRVSMTIDYNKKRGMIIYDHLSPKKPKYTGNHEYYGPDGSYDALYFYYGAWHHKEDIALENK